MSTHPPDRRGPPVVASVIVPTLNEADNIDPLVGRIVETLGGRVPFEIVVVDDGSTDATQERVRAWEARAPVRLIVRRGERGLAGAVMRGAAEARGEIVAVMDADLSHPPEKLGELIDPILEDAADVVIGSRYVHGGRPEGWPLRRYVTSRVAALLASPLIDASDPMAGFFAVRRDTLLGLDEVDGAGFKILLELLARRFDVLRVHEVPIEFRDREHGASKLGAGVILAYLRQLATLAGAAASGRSAVRFGLVGLLGFGVDLSVFTLISALGATLGAAHMASFAVATVVNYVLNELWSFRAPEGGERPRVGLSRYAMFLFVCLAALFLRGGVLATGVDFFGLPDKVALVLAIGVAAFVNYLGSAFLVFARPQAGNSVLRWRVAFVAIVLYSLALRVAYMGAIDLIPEEAYYWNYAQHPSIGYLDHPPMIAWLIGAATYLFGNSELAVRLPVIGCSLVTLGFAFALAHRVAGRTAAFAAAALVSLLPFFFAIGTLAMPDAPLTACWAGALYFLHRVLVGGRRAAWIGFGACIGLGMLSKYTIALLGPAALVLMLVDRPSRRWFRSPYPYLAVVLAAALFTPVIVWNALNGWASFAFQSVRRLEESFHFGLHELLGFALVLLSPVGLIAAVLALVQRGGTGSADVARRDRRFAVVMTLVPLAVFVIFSLSHPPKLNWTGPLWLAVLPLIGRDLVAWWRPTPAVAPAAAPASAMPRPLLPSRPSRPWELTIVVLVLLFGAGFHYLSLGLPGLGYPGSMSTPIAWEELAGSVERIEDDLEDRLDLEPMVVGMDHYFIASELAFYRTKMRKPGDAPGEGVADTSNRHLFGRSGLMYAVWFPPATLDGCNMLLVGDEERDIDDSRVAEWFDEVTPIQAIPINKNGHHVVDFYYRLGMKYDHRRLAGHAPAQEVVNSASMSP